MTDKRIRIIVDADKAKKEVKSLDREVDRLDDSAKRTNDSFFRMAKVAAAVGAALVVSRVTQYADAFTSLQNQLRQTVNSSEELADVTQKVLDVANRSRAGVASTAELYTQLNLSTEELGLSQEKLLRITETINKSFAVSGKTTEEANGAIRQLSQGLAAGALRGDEFNSVAEGAPEIMRAIAKETGLTIGALREFAADGKITTELLVRSLENAADTIDGKLDNSVQTLGQSMTVANNNMTAFIGSNETVQQVTQLAGESVVFLSENLDEIARVAEVLAAALSAKLLIAIGENTSAYIKKTAAAIASAKATKISLAAELEAATAEKAKALATLQKDMIELKNIETAKKSTAGFVLNKQAMEALTIAENRATASRAALSAATEKATVAQGRYNAVAGRGVMAANGLRGAMALLGGPAGIVTIAAGALFYFVTEASRSREAALELADGVDTAKVSFEEFNAEVAKANLARMREEFAKVEIILKNLQDVQERGGGNSKAFAEGLASIKEEYERLERGIRGVNEQLLIGSQYDIDNLTGPEIQGRLESTTKQLVFMEGVLATVQERFDQGLATKEGVDRIQAMVDQLRKASDFFRSTLGIEPAQPSAAPEPETDDKEAKRLARMREISKQAVAEEKAQTASLQLELQTRRQIQTAYNQVRLVDAKDYFAQERALIEARRQEERALIQQEQEEYRAQTDMRREQILNDTMLTEQAKTALLAELDAQRMANIAMYEDARTEAERKAADDRKAIAADEAEFKDMMQQRGMQAGLDAISRYGPQLFSKNKKLAKASALVATYSSVQKSWDNAGGYPWGIVPAGLALAIGLKNVANIGKTNISGGGGAGGGSVSAGGGGSVPTVRQPDLVQQPQQSNVLEIRGLSEIAKAVNNRNPNELFPMEQTQQIVNALVEYNRLSGEGDA